MDGMRAPGIEKVLRSLFDVTEMVGEQLAPSYHVAPTQRLWTMPESAPREEPDAAPVRHLPSDTIRPGRSSTSGLLVCRDTARSGSAAPAVG